MRNVILFINICIVAGASIVLLDFGSHPTAPEAPLQDDSRVSTKSDGSAAAGNTLASLEQNHVSPKHRRAHAAHALSKKEETYVNEFIGEMTQRRIYYREQAQLASQRGTVRALKDYGAWMVLHQQQMLDDLNKLAAYHGIKTTASLDSRLADDLSDLGNLHGKKFDTQYIKTMTAEHKRDIQRLERAGYSQDPELQVFAARYISIAKDNLSKLQKIRRGR